MPAAPSTNAGRQWTPDRLRAAVAAISGDSGIVVVANREPLRHERDDAGRVVARRSASGLVTALEPVLDASCGTWVAHGSGDADRAVVDDGDAVMVRSGSAAAYRLRRVWLDPEEERRYYYGFANEGLWPLCHRVHVRPVFRAADFVMYAQVNDRFAAVACEEARGDAPVVFVQDYHFALAPQLIRGRMPNATVITFWHIPWPTPRAFEICPWGRDLVRGLLGSSVLGFHTRDDCAQFLDTVAATIGDARIDRARGLVAIGGQTTAVRAYPIPSPPWPNRAAEQCPPVEECRRIVREEERMPGDTRLILGVDRLDYTKGLCEKIAAFSRMLERHPEYRGRVTLLQVAEPSRTLLPAYRQLGSQLRALVADVNAAFGDAAWRPVILRDRHHDPVDVYRLMRAADVCYVGSLHDGMNLVAKEFVTARTDRQGVLLLSAFTGASHQLREAITINPYDVDACAVALVQALRMDAHDQASRMHALRASVSSTNSYWWAGQMVQDAAEWQNRASAPARVSAARNDVPSAARTAPPRSWAHA